MTTFSTQEIKNFRAYAKVQKSNRYNMLDPRAAQAAGLTKDEMVFVMENYDALEAAAHVQEKL